MRHSRDVKKMDSKKLVRVVVGTKSRPEHAVLPVVLAREIGTFGTTSRGGSSDQRVLLEWWRRKKLVVG
jgi:hypothetical protein